MIVTIGEAAYRDGTWDGAALAAAEAAAGRDASVAYFCAVSQDGAGGELLEHLVSSCIMFDPDLARNPAPSGACRLTRDGLLAALRVNSDVRVCLVAGPSLTDRREGEAILSALDAYRPQPFVVLQPHLTERPDCPDLEERLAEGDLVVVDDGDLAVLCPGADASSALDILSGKWQVPHLWYVGKNASVWKTPAWTVHEGPLANRRGGVGLVLADLHDRGCFGADGGMPEDRLTLESVKEAVAHAAAS